MLALPLPCPMRMAHTAEHASLRSFPSETWNTGRRESRGARMPVWTDGDPRIARALHWAQTLPSGDGPHGAHRLRTLDELIALAEQGRGWGRVFKQLKAEGLIHEQTLGHVVARWTGRRHALRTAPATALRAALTHAPIRTA
jgi:hypothetical protein